MSGGRLRVVLIDDAESTRLRLVEALERDGDIDVTAVASAPDPASRIEAVRADVVVIDLVEEARGLSCIEHVMGFSPRPILVLTPPAGHRSTLGVEALVAGAAEALPRPTRWGTAAEAHLRARVRAIRGVSVIRHPRGRLARQTGAAAPGRGRRVVAIAASTGGPSALVRVLSGLTGIEAPVLLVQHLHADFVAGLVSWLASRTALRVVVAEHGAALESGTVYVGQAGRHLRMSRDRNVSLDEHPVTLHRPSGDELFRSVAEHAGPAGIGVLLTGMGEDGAEGMAALRRAGGLTIAQDAETSAVFGMPAAAIRRDAAAMVLPLDGIASAIRTALQRTRARP